MALLSPVWFAGKELARQEQCQGDQGYTIERGKIIKHFGVLTFCQFSKFCESHFVEVKLELLGSQNF